MSLPFLPHEIRCIIMYKFKGLQHPTSNIIKDYFKELDKEFSIYKHIEKITEETYISQDNHKILLTSKTSFNTTFEDYPRIFFPPDLDIITEKIISNII